MIALLGPPPQSLNEHERVWSEEDWGRDTLENPAGKPCANSREYLEGPFFDQHGKRPLVRASTWPKTLSLIELVA